MIENSTYTITAPETLDAAPALPASKSISNRALILHALAGGTHMPQNLSDCDDTRVMTAALAHRPPVVDIMAAGTAMRFLTAYFSTCDGEEHIMTGTERMRHRPIGILVDALRQLGADIGYEGADGFPPLVIRGRRLSAVPLSIPGSVSSQYISALLMIGPVLEGGLDLRLTGSMVSRPYIDLTLRLMRHYGATADWTATDSLHVGGGGYRDVPCTVENDWSAASYWYEAAALSGGRVRLEGLFADSGQGDSRGAALFRQLGVETEFRADGSVMVCGGGEAAERLEADLVDMPDLAQTFVVTCCLMGVTFRFCGLQSLRIKETDRMAALTAELEKLGYVLRTEGDDALLWDGTRCAPAPSPVVRTYEDHRMAMAFAPAALRLPSGIRIAAPQVVSKSYPAYWDALRSAGFRISSF